MLLGCTVFARPSTVDRYCFLHKVNAKGQRANSQSIIGGSFASCVRFRYTIVRLETEVQDLTARSVKGFATDYTDFHGLGRVNPGR